MRDKTDRQQAPIRVSVETWERARRLAARAARDGWKSIGVKRSDPPTMVAVVEEALRKMGTPR